MAKAHFSRDYNHTWPSRAVTEYKAGWSGTVRQEVLDAATAAGAIVGEKKRGRGRPPKAEQSPPALPSATDPAATVADAPGAQGDPIPPNNGVDADSNSQ